VQAPFIFLGVGKQAHDHQTYHDKSGDEVLHHDYHSPGSACLSSTKDLMSDIGTQHRFAAMRNLVRYQRIPDLTSGPPG
jgi:hypothetical protein